MGHTYPECPDCGERKHTQPLFPGEGTYPAPVFHEHRGCETSKYFVLVHPDGTTEALTTIPGDRRFEEAAARLE